MTRSKMLTMLIAVGAVVLTSAVTPASARRGAWRGAAITAGVVAAGVAAAAASNAYYGGYGYGGYGYGYGRYHGRCGGGAYC
jgi:hypothetical protein